MRYFTLFIFFFIAQFPFAQSKASFEYLVSESTCRCLEQQKSLTNDNFQSCLLESFEKNESLISKELWRRYRDTTYESSVKMGKKVMDSLTVTMVHTCNAYFQFADSSRFSAFVGIDNDSIPLYIKTLEQKNKVNLNRDFYFSRGFLYFVMKSFGSALQDFDKALLLNAKNTETLVYKAFTLELMMDYSKAVAIYDKLGLLTGNRQFKVMSAICKRKQNGN